MEFLFITLISAFLMASSNYYSNSDYTPPTTSSSSENDIPTPSEEPRHSYERQPTGHTPNKKKAKKYLELSPRTKDKIDDIRHNQQNIINLQRDMYYEQRINSKKLSLLEAIGIKFCGKNIPKDWVDEPVLYSRPSSSNWNTWQQTPRPPPYSPNSWDCQPQWSPIKPFNERNHLEISNGKSPKSPKTPKTPK